MRGKRKWGRSERRRRKKRRNKRWDARGARVRPIMGVGGKIRHRGGGRVSSRQRKKRKDERRRRRRRNKRSEKSVRPQEFPLPPSSTSSKTSPRPTPSPNHLLSWSRSVVLTLQLLQHGLEVLHPWRWLVDVAGSSECLPSAQLENKQHGGDCYWKTSFRSRVSGSARQGCLFRSMDFII